MRDFIDHIRPPVYGRFAAGARRPPALPHSIRRRGLPITEAMHRPTAAFRPCAAPQPPRAFTLLEIMIVLVMLAIIALIVIPSGQDEQTRLRHAASLLLADIEYAQIQSLGDGADPMLLAFDGAEHMYHLARQSSPDDPVNDPSAQAPFVTRFGEGRAFGLGGVKLERVDVGPDDQLRFTAMGALQQASDATIQLRCGSHQLTIRVDAATGDARVD